MYWNQPLWMPRCVCWEREVREIPEKIDSKNLPQPRDVLGGRTDLDPARNETGIGLLVDEEGVTRYFRRVIPTTAGDLASFPWQIVNAYGQPPRARTRAT